MKIPESCGCHIMVSVDEAAKMLGVSVSTIYGWCITGKIISYTNTVFKRGDGSKKYQIPHTEILRIKG